MKKMILIERSKFALLVRSHMKASNMLLVLQHVCRERRISLSMTQEEVCPVSYTHLTLPTTPYV